MQQSLSAQSKTTSYDACTGQVQFKMPINSPMEFTGYVKLRLWIEVQGADDMDVFITVTKYDHKTNRVIESLLKIWRRHLADPKECEAYFDAGPMGCIRASHRELDEEQSSPLHPGYLHQREQMLQPGEVVPLDIAIWPYGMIYNPGEELRVTISGVNLKEHRRPNNFMAKLRNQGKHVIYTGGDRDSYLLFPLIPATE